MQAAFLVSLVLAADPAAVAAPKPAAIDFARDVQPILKAHCYDCHGPETQESGLRLDIRAAALEGGDGGPLFVPGNSNDSDLITRVATDDEETRMPPDGEALSKEQITLLRNWIDAGADWPDDGIARPRKHSDHWSFQVPRRAALPEVKDKDWVRNEIDRFVLALLEEKQITPAPEADRQTLLRRLSLDLTGLPPTPEETDQFLSDARAGAYERLVDRLLSSRHFGERWGRHWLDMARYADSNGYERDDVRPNAWRYRDWVINAVNDDMPYDRFTIEQVAGDLLPKATLEQKIATGFHRMTIKNTESGINKEDYRNREVVDRANTTGTIFLGLTVGCSQCHSHKYDPISQREYYSFYAFFNNLREVDIDIAGTDKEQRAYRSALALHEEKGRRLHRRQKLFDAMAKGGVDAWQQEVAKNNEAYRRQLAAQQKLQTWDNTAWQRDLTPELIKALRLPKEVKAALAVAEDQRDEKQRTVLTDYHSALEQKNQEVEGMILSIEQHLAVLDDPTDVKAAIALPKTERNTDQAARVAQFEAVLKSRSDDLKKEIRHLGVEKRYLPKPYVMTAAENRKDPRATHVLVRGDFKQQGQQVEPTTFSVLHELTPRAENPDRLDLARWLVDPGNPLTARVAVNHIWQHLFGSGLVASVDDFGTQGEAPSHPGLLDWLALEFPARGWSRKELIKRIVTSATYRQSSRYRPELVKTDPLNLLLARQSRYRVEGEIIRDLFLTAGGLLERHVGGKTIRPPAPASIRDVGYKYQLIWEVSRKPDRYRRGMYIHFKRSNPFPSLMVFDVPESTLCAARRNRSNTPLQALTTLNDPVFVECAQALGRRILEQGPAQTEARIEFAGQICLSRQLKPPEIETLKQLYESERAAYRQRPEGAREFVGEYRSKEHPDHETAAWTAVARALMNLDQFVTRE